MAPNVVEAVNYSDNMTQSRSEDYIACFAGYGSAARQKLVTLTWIYISLPDLPILLLWHGFRDSDLAEYGRSVWSPLTTGTSRGPLHAFNTAS